VSALPDLTERVADVRWYDHHQWNEELAEFVDDQGVERVVGDSDEVCTADVVLAELDHEFGEQFAELAAVTRDHDLWIREDERSDDLADLSYWSEPEEYIEYVLEHGPDLSPEIHEFLAEKRVEKEALIEKAVQRAELRDVGEWTVGVTYGRCSQNEVAEALRGGAPTPPSSSNPPARPPSAGPRTSSAPTRSPARSTAAATRAPPAASRTSTTTCWTTPTTGRRVVRWRSRR